MPVTTIRNQQALGRSELKAYQPTPSSTVSGAGGNGGVSQLLVSSSRIQQVQAALLNNKDVFGCVLDVEL